LAFFFLLKILLYSPNPAPDCLAAHRQWNVFTPEPASYLLTGTADEPGSRLGADFLFLDDLFEFYDDVDHDLSI